MPSYDLEILRQHREEILKAELGAFLHNIGKFGREFLFDQLAGAGNRDPAIVRYRDTFEYRNVVGIKYRLHPDRYRQKQETLDFLEVAVRTWLENTIIQLPAPFNDRSDHCLGDFIEYQDLDFYRPRSHRDWKEGRWPNTSHLTELLEACHHASAVDKELNGGGAKQAQLPVHLATVFGFERSVHLDALKPSREKLLTAARSTGGRVYVTEAHGPMTAALGDTRRPLNDITLWDVSSAVAAFYKAAMAKMLLEGDWTGRDALKWRILRVALNGPDFYDYVSRLPDLLVRKRIIEHGLDEVRTLLEETCPIANEVYRDEFGSAFVVPDLEGEDPNGSVILGLLRDHIRDAFLTSLPVGSGDQRQRQRAEASGYAKREILPQLSVTPAHERALGLAEELVKPSPPVSAKPQDVARWWQGVDGEEICTVCGVRPQGNPPGRTSPKARQRRLCVPCEALREDRCEEWLTSNLERTIWLDEVADLNGRVALLVGRFAIEDWLKPDGYVERSLVGNAGASDPSARFKKLTFARLRRIWDTTARFWEEVELETELAVPPARRWRLRLQLGGNSDDIVSTHAYELDIEDLGRLAVACAAGAECRFITAENLERVAKQLERDLEGLVQRVQGKRCTLYEDRYDETAGYTRLTEIATGTIREVSEDPTQYRGLIPVVADPRSFMILLPASTAADILELIKSKYEAEMARVRNRLAVALGIVFAEAHAPVSALLDAGRRMMKLPVDKECWTIADAPQRCGNDWVLTFENRVSWRVPAVMQDGTTEDQWYSYFLPYPAGEAVHIRDLQKGKQVWVTPSRFDFQFLDCAATRFELHYSEAARKKRLARPYLLEQWASLSRVWDLLSDRLATSQIKALQADISAKRRQWADGGRDAFATFVEDTLATAGWSSSLCAADLEFLTQAGISGLLEDAIELHMGILKRKPGQGG